MRISMKESLKNVDYDKSVRPKVVQRNTFQFTNKEGIIITRLHNTNIIHYNPKDGRTILNSNGYKTVTTKDRMNNFSDYRIYQENSIWYVSATYSEENQNPKRVIYYDGIVLPDALTQNNIDENLYKLNTKTLIKKINQFVNQIDKLSSLPMPNGGDCWDCSMFESKQHKPGECPKDTSGHIMSHIEENYLYGSLIVNAMTWAGYGEKQIAFAFQTGMNKHGVKSALKRYLKRRLGLAN